VRRSIADIAMMIGVLLSTAEQFWKFAMAGMCD
jgi:hypothetical protein